MLIELVWKLMVASGTCKIEAQGGKKCISGSLQDADRLREAF